MLTIAQKNKIFGEPNETGKGYIVKLELPYPMYYQGAKVKSIQCHKLVKDRLLKIFTELLAHYGQERLHELEIDVYDGCFCYRKMRGGTSLSSHSWGIAIDLNAKDNGLNTPVSKAQFAKPEYNKMFEIFERNGFINYGKVKGFDTMHFEAAW